MRTEMRISVPRLSLVLVLGLTACAHPENYRWADTSKPGFQTTLTPPTTAESDFTAWEKPSVSVYSAATPTPDKSDASLKDLSDRGQAAFIEAMTKAGAKPDEIRDMLAKPIKAKATPAETSVSTEGTYKRTLVANVTKGWSAKPGDRLVWTWIDIRPVNFLFDGYSVVATDNQVLNIEQITNATTASLEGSLGKTSSNTEVNKTAGTPTATDITDALTNTLGLKGNLSHTYTTTAAINQQYVKLGADIIPTELRIYRESERNLDVAGNTLINLTMRIDPSRWTNTLQIITQRITKLDLADDKGKLHTPKTVVFEVGLNQAPPRCALTAQVRLYYQIRQVVDGRSYVEGQQDATYSQGVYSPAEPVVIVPAEDIRKPSWQIVTQTAGAKPLQVKDIFGYDLPIDFTSYEQAHNFAEWLNRNGSSFFGKVEPAIGSAGLKLSSGVAGAGTATAPIYQGPYDAAPTYRPTDAVASAKLKRDCAGMANVPPAPVAIPPAVKPQQQQVQPQ